MIDSMGAPARLIGLDRVLSHRWWLPSLLAATVLVRLSMFHFAPSSDEGGFLYLADQWHAGGSSLYGDHWVDRPPLLVGFFGLAGAWGGMPTLRLMGCGLAAASVLLAHRIGWRLGGPRGAGVASALAAMGTSSALFGAWQVDGELIAVPLVLVGLLLLMSQSPWTWACAGAAGAAAMLVKQNFADVLIAGVVLLAGQWASDRSAGRNMIRRLGALLAGALAMLVLVLVLADQRGTSPSELWDAVVTFRGEASSVIVGSATSSTGWRLARLVLVLFVSGAGVVLAMLLARASTRRRDPWTVVAAVLTVWGLVGMFAGGSYWLHYLIGLVPAMVVSAALLAASAERLTVGLRGAVVMALISTIVSTGWSIGVNRPDEMTEEYMGDWLGAAADPGDTAVVLVGRPNILYVAGLDSPYRELWSLPVRVRDPELSDLVAVLQGPRPPTWLILTGRGMATWGVDATEANQVARQGYVLARRMCGYTVVLRAGLDRDLPPDPACG